MSYFYINFYSFIASREAADFRDFQGYILLKKGSFPLRISLVNVTKSAGKCGFGHISEEILNGKLHFLCT